MCTAYIERPGCNIGVVTNINTTVCPGDYAQVIFLFCNILQVIWQWFGSISMKLILQSQALTNLVYCGVVANNPTICMTATLMLTVKPSYMYSTAHAKHFCAHVSSEFEWVRMSCKQGTHSWKLTRRLARFSLLSGCFLLLNPCYSIFVTWFLLLKIWLCRIFGN